MFLLLLFPYRDQEEEKEEEEEEEEEVDVDEEDVNTRGEKTARRRVHRWEMEHLIRYLLGERECCLIFKKSPFKLHSR